MHRFAGTVLSPQNNPKLSIITLAGGSLNDLGAPD